MLRDMVYGGLGNVGLTVELDDLKGLFRPKQFYDSKIKQRMERQPPAMNLSNHSVKESLNGNRLDQINFHIIISAACHFIIHQIERTSWQSVAISRIWNEVVIQVLLVIPVAIQEFF